MISQSVRVCDQYDQLVASLDYNNQKVKEKLDVIYPNVEKRNMTKVKSKMNILKS